VPENVVRNKQSFELTGDFAMYILLEEGMLIDYGDEALDADGLNWEQMSDGFLGFGEPYRKDHFPMRRKINTVEELFASYNTQSTKG
jgi:hypothetical protein